MKTESVDLINIICMVGATFLAYFFPFELFLFSYAVLGPLHYLTEVSWLHNKKYFIGFSYDSLLLFAIGVGITFFYLTGFSLITNFAASLMFFAFFSSFIFVTIKEAKLKYFLIGLIFLSSLLIRFSQFSVVLFATLLPTIVHVFIFTGCFMLYGALKSKSKTGLVAVLVFLLCFILLFVVTVNVRTFTVSNYIQDAYSSFTNVNLEIMNLANIHNPDVQYAIYHSQAGLSIMRFIAFAYTYHYLNWFSKTKIIHWDRISHERLAAILTLWLASVGLYILNYRTGLIVLYFLSLLHVLLEFPLNHRSFIGIYQEIKNRISGTKQITA